MSGGKTGRKEDYRPCVGIMLLNRSNLVWVGHRLNTDNDEGSGNWWQMPQGGIDEGEDPKAAALRELYEETHVRSASIIAKAPGWYYYDLPPQLIGVAWGGRWRGQRQKWFAARFEGADSEIDIRAPVGHKAEFDAWRWVPMADLESLIVPFKRDVYRDIVSAFRHLAG